METNEKTFRHSFGKLAWMSMGLLFLGYVTFVGGNRDYFWIGLELLVFIIVLFYTTSRVKISEERLTTGGLLGSKSLGWPEIGRVSMRGQALRLHNYDNDLILTIDPQLEGYKEILDTVFSKRPDLLDVEENRVISSAWLGNIVAPG